MISVLDLSLILLVIQGAIGAFDVLYNHEWDARLPTKPAAAKELGIHGVRAVLYAVLFAGIAWFNWLGVFAVLLALLILVEIFLTLWDFVVEDKTRTLSPLERTVHTVLAMNGGAYVLPQASGLQAVDRGWVSVVLTAYALGVFASGVRDGYASRRLARA
jgi:uncharacterized protein